MRFTALLWAITAVAIAAPSSTASKAVRITPKRVTVSHKHGPPCRTLRCERAWGRKHHWHRPPPPFHWTYFIVCMANHEHGSWPGGTVNTVLWHTKNGNYEGGLEWENPTWVAQVKLMPDPQDYPDEAVLASPQQQAEVFIHNVFGMGGWPSSEIAECTG